MDPDRVIEAVLFSSSSPVKVAEIADKAQLSQDAVRRALRRLITEYEGKECSIEVVKTGMKYSMQLRKDYVHLSASYSVQELDAGVVKTAAIIAYNQPILQSDLAKKRGSNVYDDIRTLRHLGLVTGKKTGQTLLLSTTKKFSEYFGISTRKEDIKEWMESCAKKQ
ncbi:MAG: SMC-Scp complex subunit ScpB [Methanomassiliicoccales archaeon]